MRLHNWLTRGLAAAALALAGMTTVASGQSAESEKPKGKQPVVTIGSKRFTENVILGEMIAHMARAAGAKAIHRSDLGGTPIVFKSLEEGAIDIYAEYTGTLSADILGGESVRNDQQLRAALARRGVRMSERLGFNNTYALGMKDAHAEKLGLTRISQLANHPELRMGFSEEFMNRADGWPGLARHYNLPHKPRVLDHDLAYRGLEQGSIDVTDLYSTDAEVRFYGLRLLEDDRGYFPQYHCVLLYRDDLEERMPKVVTSIRHLEGKINNEQMLELNAKAKLDRLLESRVAADFVAETFNLQVEFPESSVWHDIWLKTLQHLYLVAISLSLAVVAGIPLGIWSYKWPPLGQVILALIGILQTLPSMAVLVFMIPLCPVSRPPR